MEETIWCNLFKRLLTAGDNMPKAKINRTKEEKKRLQREYYHKNKEIISQQTAKSYRKHRQERLANMRKYYLAHKEQIHEYQRQYLWAKRGLVAPVKKYQFYRDTIRLLDQSDPFWDLLLSLPLTAKQKQVVQLTRQYQNMKEVAYQIGLGNQSTITKYWNGTYFKKYGKYYGGIHNKYLKYLSTKVK